MSLAEALADTSVTFESLDLLAAPSACGIEPVLRWGAFGCSVRSLASEIQDAAMRISGLVTAIKGFTHMDQAAVAAPVDIAAGLKTPSPCSERRRGQIGRRSGASRTRTAEGARFCRRAQPDLGEPHRQRARCHRRLRPRRGDRQPRHESG